MANEQNAKVFIKTLGCKVNTYDGDSLITELKKRGYVIVDDAGQADIAILNSCSVTTEADKESRYILRRYRRDNPKGTIVATGCYAQTDSHALAAMDEVDLVIPNTEKQDFVGILEAKLPQIKDQGRSWLDKLPDGVKAVEANRQGHFKSQLVLKPADPSRTRSFLKIQDGCNGFCTYCIIPYARGASRSVRPEEIKAEVRRQIELGTKEIVLTGIHIGDFGSDLGLDDDCPIASLVNELFSWPDMVRLRISSLEPMELSESLLRALNNRPELFCHHFHMPLQSGSDRILRLMRRSYDTKAYASKLELARRYFPDAYFSCDVIPGFPSETDNEAMETEAFIESIGLNELHVFPYSRRPNTAADRMPGHLDPKVIKERARSLRELSNKLKTGYLSRFIGETNFVLWERGFSKSGYHHGRSLNYIEVVAPRSSNIESGTISKVRFKGFHAPGILLGMPC